MSRLRLFTCDFQEEAGKKVTVVHCGCCPKLRISLLLVAMPWDWLRQSLSVALHRLRQVSYFLSFLLFRGLTAVWLLDTNVPKL